MISAPPSSAHRAVSPVPAPNIRRGRPASLSFRRRSSTCRRVKLLATGTAPPFSRLTEEMLKFQYVGEIVMAPLPPFAGQHLVEQLCHEIGEFRFVQVLVDEKHIQVRFVSVDYLA